MWHRGFCLLAFPIYMDTCHMRTGYLAVHTSLLHNSRPVMGAQMVRMAWADTGAPLPAPRGGPLEAPSHAPASGHDTTFVTASAPSTDLVPTTNLLQTKLTRFMSPSRGEVKGSLPLCLHATLRVRIRPIKRLLGACVPAIGGSTWDVALLFAHRLNNCV